MGRMLGSGTGTDCREWLGLERNQNVEGSDQGVISGNDLALRVLGGRQMRAAKLALPKQALALLS